MIYEKENQHAYIDDEQIKSLNPLEETFLVNFMDCIETSWKDPDFNVVTFAKTLGYSKSQLYRKTVNLTGKSPNTFIRDYRLDKAMTLLHEQQGNISEIAFESGFNSLGYFSECFKNKFGLLPSKYIQQHIF